MPRKFKIYQDSNTKAFYAKRILLGFIPWTVTKSEVSWEPSSDGEEYEKLGNKRVRLEANSKLMMFRALREKYSWVPPDEHIADFEL
jgi:hypothetical protein